ncbi:MAG TPA: pyruvate, phosphate dikinase [Bacillota bacterium]|nr:MAG: Pyruvate, phosphate dikinase [Firmicutes bacterium ADurb.Bin153]HNV34709.1 pyruvate, phosphate dikinase [Bacillota bacterium]
MERMVYFFGAGITEGSEEMKNQLGGKGCNLAGMAKLGLPVPPGFTITTDTCIAFYTAGSKWPEGLKGQVQDNLKKLEEATGKKLGSKENPLLVSVRSGARASMPGMMDTILNLGLTNDTVKAMVKLTSNPRFAYDSYRRFIEMYADVVMGVDRQNFEHAMDELKHKKGVKLDTDLDAADMEALTGEYKAIYKKHLGEDFPEDPWTQLEGAVNAVFRSWNNQRAITYRKLNAIPDEWGTAVNVQSMVFGNTGEESGTGVAFTRNPSTGENKFYGEYLMNAQGEDVVAGIRTPHPIADLERDMPDVYTQLVGIYKKLENHYRDMQDIEFTIENRKLYMLQTRSGKRTGAAAVRIAVEMVKEGLIDEKTAVLRVAPSALDQLLHPMIDPKAKVDAVAKGLPASPGAAVGQVVFNAEDAVEWQEKGEKVILVRTETSPEDISGMHAAQGILTSRGGMTSHAAVVARGMGKCCVAGCGDVIVEEKKKVFHVNGHVVKEGDWITINGSTGELILGQVKLVSPELSGYFGELMAMADKFRALKVRTNADTPKDAAQARAFGAEGIGLTRTEHMFFAEDRIKAVREMILADNVEDRKAALAKVQPFQKADFVGIFEAMKGLPVTVRLLDPPLHEFLPQLDMDKQIEEIASELGVPKGKIVDRIQSLHELNPMLGFRGCRIGIVYPEIFDMQITAIFEAACELKKKGVEVIPEVMFPLVGTSAEMKMLKDSAVRIADAIIAKYGVELEYMMGTMIEIPRAAVIADVIAKDAEFFSFGTNDLTQMGFGYSRDDAGKFLPVYVNKKVLKADPFQTIDVEGIGKLVDMGVKLGRKTRHDLKCGVCGEHGGDPDSIEFFHGVGLNYVSCSPFRVPIARLAAAQANIKNPR